MTRFAYERDVLLYFWRVYWDAYFKMASTNAAASLKKKGKTKLTDQDMDVFAEVIFDPQYRGSDYTIGWARVLERLALKEVLKGRNFRQERWKSKIFQWSN